MSNAAIYRTKAAECDARASREIDPIRREQWEGMAKSYRLLAEQADRNVGLARMHEAPEPNRPVQMQQQQQVQPKAGSTTANQAENQSLPEQPARPGTQNEPAKDKS